MDNRCLGRLADLANAYKHCVRGINRKGAFVEHQNVPHAAQLAPTNILAHLRQVDAEIEIDITFKYEGLADADHETLAECFRFWIGYVNDEIPIAITSAVKEER
jgi:hypothetical protein